MVGPKTLAVLEKRKADSSRESVCSESCIGWTERQLELRQKWSWHAARASAAEDIASTFSELAGTEFAKGNDSEAKQKRNTKDWLLSWAKNERELQSKAKELYESEFPE